MWSEVMGKSVEQAGKAIRVRSLGKKYRVAAARSRGYRTLRQELVDVVAAPVRRALGILTGHAAAAANLDDTFWALEDVTLDIDHGEVVGLIGANGAGKSTLLRILAGITTPTTGWAELYGRVGALLEVGTGFHPELSGRENVYLNGTILGMSHAEIDEKLDQIVEFSEIGRFIDTPIKHYSSGMALRLGFSVAAHLEPEILLVDEVLAVGDVAFQKKCMGKIGQVAGEGRTVIFVSHNLGAVNEMTRKAIWIDQGKVRSIGPSHLVVGEYLESFDSMSAGHITFSDDKAQESRGIITSLKVLSGDSVAHAVRMGSSVTFEVAFESEVALSDPGMGIGVDHLGKGRILSLSTEFAGCDGEAEGALSGTFTCRIEELYLNEGDYLISVGIADGGKVVEWREKALKLQVVRADVFDTGVTPNPHRGVIYLPHKWKFRNDSRV